MTKPNVSRSIESLLNSSTNWTLTGSLARTEIEFIVDEKASVVTNKPTVWIQKGRTFSHDEGLPKGVVSWTEQEVYVTPMAPDVSGQNDTLWSMREEIRRIVKANRQVASGIENITFGPRSPRTANAGDPLRGNEVVLVCLWREI